jgi:hypothetical protein
MIHNLLYQDHLQANTYSRKDNTKKGDPTITNSLQTFDAIVIFISIVVMSGPPSICPEKFVVKISETF